MSSNEPFSVEDFLDKLAANAPEVALNPAIQAGLYKLAQQMGLANAPASHLLVVDDNDADVSLLRAALAENGVAMEVVHARDGYEALDYFEGKGRFSDRHRFPLPQLTILDMKMPGISGVEVLKRMRQLPDCSRLMVIALTSIRNEDEMAQALSYCISAYLVKPQTLAELVALVRQVKTSWIDTIIKLKRG